MMGITEIGMGHVFSRYVAATVLGVEATPAVAVWLHLQIRKCNCKIGSNYAVW
jgi:hypothetical protein